MPDILDSDPELQYAEEQWVQLTLWEDTVHCRWCFLKVLPYSEDRWADEDGVTYCVDAEHFHSPQEA